MCNHKIACFIITGERIVDKLFQVSLKDPQQGTMLIHIEIQGQRVKHFARRMFVYRCLSIPLAIIYNQAVHRIEEEKNMAFITTAELIGRQQGRAEGIQKGMQKGGRMLLLRLLKRKFLAIRRNFLHNINKADTKTLLKWGERLIDAKTLQDVFAE